MEQTAEQKAIAFHEKHKAYMRNYMKKTYAAHREERIEQSKSYYRAHKAEILAKNKAYYETHKTEILAKCKEMHKAYKEFKNKKSIAEVV